MNVNIGLRVDTKGEELVDRLNRKVKALEASLKAISRQMQATAKAAATSSGSRPSQGQKTNQGKSTSAADKRAISDLYSIRSRLEAQRQRESTRNEQFLHRLRQSSYRQAERDQAKAIRDRVAGEARAAREAKSAQAAAARAASAEMRAIREKIQFQVRTSAQRVREQAATERSRAAQAAAIVREQRQNTRDEAKALRDRMSFVSRMANQRAREEASTERDRQAAMRETIRLDRYRMGLRDREERRLHRESVARDQERDRLRGSAISNARSAVHYGGDALHRSARGIAGAGAVAAGAGALAARTGIGARMETDTAETNLSIFSEQTREQIRDARRGWLDREAIKNGLNVAGGLNAYNEVLKTGMKSPVENTKSIIGAVSALELDLKDTTKLAGLIDRNYGANSSPAKIKSALNAIAVAAREDPTQAPEIVEGMKRGFGALSMGNMKPEELAALVSGGQSVGIQPGKAGTFIATLGKQLSSGANRFLDPKNRKELNFAASAMGFGNSREMARQFREDSTGTIMKVLEAMKAMDPTKRTTVASALSGNQWNDEDLQIVNGLDGLKNTLAAVRDPSNAGFVDEAARKRQTSWLGQWNSTKAIFNRFWESFGAGFDEILQAVNDYFLNLHGRFDFDQVTDIVKQGLEGVKEALGVKSWRELLSGMFGGNLAGVGQEVRSFARGFTAGVMEIVNGIKSVAAFFAGPGASTEEIGKLVGRLITLAAACVVVAPAISIISSLATGIFLLSKGIVAAWNLVKAAGLVGATSTAATAGGGAAGAGAAGAAAGAGLLARLTGILGKAGIFAGAGINTVPSFTKDEADDLMKRFGKFAQERNKAREESSREWVDPPAKSAAESIIVPSPQVVKPVAPVKPMEEMRKPVEDLRDSIDRNTLIHKQSFESQDTFSGLIRKAAFTTSDTGRIAKASIQGGASDLRSAVLSGSTGSVGSVGSGGGGPLSGSTPGSSLGNVGIGGRGIIGGGQTSPGLSAGAGSSGSDAAGPAVPGDKRMGGSRSWRNNNPGNIEYGPFARSMGATGTDGRFAVFPDYKSGRNAQEKLLFEGKNYANLTLAQAIRRWAPASENNVPAYIAAMGGDPNTRMKDFTPEQRGKLLDAMQRHEGWKPGKVVPGQAQASSVASSAPLGGASGSIMGPAVDRANSLLGANSSQAAAALGSRMTPGQWCADFVNGVLKSSGIKGVNSSVANSFQNWGEAVKDGIKKGDVLVEHRGRGPGQAGGHVGIATGNTRVKNGRVQHETISGNYGGRVGRSWEYEDSVIARRAPGADAAAMAQAAEKAKPPQSADNRTQDMAERAKPNIDALRSMDWMRRIGRGIPMDQVFKTGPDGFGRGADGNLTMPDARSAAEFLTKPRWNGDGAGEQGLGQTLGKRTPLGNDAPISPVRAGTAGGSSTTTVSAPISINGA
ncbi:phage tail tape measure protein, partial [Methylorubrum thiocyanatum]|uniref:phage tail tape measure protein n=1 Tax=Methylorubrum thiocyanatum TaxID=47958 RepID=UPI003F7E40DC